MPSPACTADAPGARIGAPMHGDSLIPVVISSIKAAKTAAASSVGWCPDASASRSGRTFSVWHDPADPSSLRIASAAGRGFELRSFRDIAAPGAGAVYDVILIEGDKIKVVGFFDGPPPIDALTPLFTDNFAVYADIDVTAHKVSVYRPY
jgi:hypothetical protein